MYPILTGALDSVQHVIALGLEHVLLVVLVWSFLKVNTLRFLLESVAIIQ